MYPIKARPEPFGHTGKPGKSTAMKRQHSDQWENSVGGMNHLVRAIYGSSDLAQDDHGNDPLCRAVNRELSVTTEPRRIVREFHTTHESVTYWEPPTVEQIESWGRRAHKQGITIVEYCAKYGLAQYAS